MAYRIGVRCKLAGSPRAQRPARQRAWYGWQLAIADGALAAGALALTPVLRRETQPEPIRPLAPLSLALVSLGSSGSFALHAAHDNWGVGLASAGLRILVPPLTALLGIAAACVADQQGPCASRGSSVGFAVGAIGVSLLDIGALATERGSDSRTEHDSYAWQTVLVDASGLSLGAYGAIRSNQRDDDSESQLSDVAALGIGLYLVGGLGTPVVHFTHGRVGIGFADAGVRLLGTPIASLVGAVSLCAAAGGRSHCFEDGFEGAFLATNLLAATLDATVLARTARERPQTAELFPVLTPIRGGLRAGVGGAF